MQQLRHKTYYQEVVISFFMVRNRKKAILILQSIFIIILLLYKTNRSCPTQNISVEQSDFDKSIKLISQIRSNYSSVNGLRYRSLICTIVRNDPHILEFLLRNLISGFSHIVVYDNNRIKAGYDINITNLLAPFVAAGVVTHVPWQQESIELLRTRVKLDNSAECLQKYGIHADWVSILDTDEYFYYEKQGVAVNTLNDLLVELEQKHFCGIKILWAMMYGEGRVLSDNRTLFETYPRKCRTIAQHKVLARPQLSNIDIPHLVTCNTTNYTVKVWKPDNISNIALVHYFSKSIEEFLIKVDRGMLPHIRRPIQTYEITGSLCDLVQFPYAIDYRNTFMNIYNEFKMFHSFRPIELLPPPILRLENIRKQYTSEYILFIYLKYRCAKREEFDHEAYMSINPDVRQAIRNGTVIDGLHHFMLNFEKGAKGCWKTNTYSICE